MTDISVADVTFVDAVGGKGCVQVNDVINAIRPTTCLVTIMLANNETGIIQVLPETDSYHSSLRHSSCLLYLPLPVSQFIVWCFALLH